MGVALSVGGPCSELGAGQWAPGGFWPSLWQRVGLSASWRGSEFAPWLWQVLEETTSCRATCPSFGCGKITSSSEGCVLLVMPVH